MKKPTINNFKTQEQVDSIRKHLQLLGHKGLGVTELRVFDPTPLVAYVDNEDDAVRLVLEMEGKTSGIYVGVQPRPLDLFDKAPNCWMPATSSPRNCACDDDIEYITTCFWDIDVVSEERSKGHPASDEELKQSLQAAKLLSSKEGLALTSAICCSGNGHYVLTPIIPIPVDSIKVARQFKQFCRQTAQTTAPQVKGIKIDSVYNLSRVCRLMGTVNRKGLATEERPHRRASFITEPAPGKSMALYYMILNTDLDQFEIYCEKLPQSIRCDLHKLEHCEFIKWCRSYAAEVSEPLWWAMITNLAHLEGGNALIHEISRLDPVRYDFADTQYKIQKAIEAGYKPVSCKTIVSETVTVTEKGRFHCSRINHCPAKAPMYMATMHTVYKR